MVRELRTSSHSSYIVQDNLNCILALVRRMTQISANMGCWVRQAVQLGTRPTPDTMVPFGMVWDTIVSLFFSRHSWTISSKWQFKSAIPLQGELIAGWLSPTLDRTLLPLFLYNHINRPVMKPLVSTTAGHDIKHPHHALHRNGSGAILVPPSRKIIGANAYKMSLPLCHDSYA